ncbi:MAG: hypothetical protein A2Z42_04800 [Candidatus Woykebacteria bacterium RBG_19FT_COMBO_43_10]|uniref:Divalent-cation tolerance protein CutA n=1 Tax=Candidatus Woykebacteria bacterium RBG_19FT_COMBO_43_10 TaxID=1802598 RepID=A0A1G1WH38_9BACT|nr:MAG: hypothetical protein A2Z42_04800 [Candidatus Woykebacteria bacterium RBG_19FT_COMBO_43_10]
MIFIFTSLPDKRTAVRVGKGLLEKRIIACYNLFPVESAYWWEGKIREEAEILIILKTKSEDFEKVETYIKKHSSYEIPEVVAVTPGQVNKSYLDWIHSETKT